jgi:nucleoside-diphosphate-sugar epimerase
VRRVFVTGATGFVGSHLVERLLYEGVAVVATVRTPSARPLPGVQYAIFDLEKPADWQLDCLRGVDCVFHLAARVHVMKQTAQDKERFRTINVAATRALAEHAALAGVPRFVYLSSIKVNGERTERRAFTASDLPAPQDDYGLSKWHAEQALQEIAANRHLSTAVVRPPLVYGPRVGANFRRLLAWVARGVPLPFGSIDNRRSLVNVWNLVDLLLTVGRNDRARNRAWLVSDNDDTSTRRLVEIMGEAMGMKARLWSVPVPLLRGLSALARREAEVARLVDSLQVDVGETCELLQWRAPVSLEDGVARTAKWFVEQAS